MKILILHLSDIHIDSKQYSDDRLINPIVSALTEFSNLNEIIIAVSGDISFSGKKEQYSHAYNFFGNLIAKIKTRFFNANKKIRVVLVPGNHDIDFKEKNRNRSEISKAWKENKVEEYILSDISKMDNFYNFANFNQCFSENKLTDKIIINCDGFNIQFNLFNTAPLSILNDENEDNDQALHYISEESIKRLDIDTNTNVSITMMHHSPYWLHETSKNIFENEIQKNSTILLTGHDHIQHSEYRNIDGNHECLIMRGGQIQLLGQESEFNCILIDTISNNIDTFDCYSENGDVYIVKKQQTRKINKFYENNGFVLNKDYLDKITSAHFNGMQAEDMFVFPSLINILEDFKDKKRIENIKDFFNELDRAEICYIEGGNLSGKTHLLNYLYLRMFDKYTPLYIDASDITGNIDEEIIRNSFYKQYSSDIKVYTKYKQLNVDSKILIIDNYDKIKNSEEFLNRIKANYCKIICSTKKTIADIKEKLVAQLKTEYSICRLEIEPFYLEKRKELIRKACKSLFSNLSDNNLNLKVKEINSFITEHLKLFDITPYFILTYCSSYAKRASDQETQLNTFSEVFKSNMVRDFNNISTIRVPTAFFIIQEIAFYIISNRIYPISVSKFCELVEKYNTRFDNKINPVKFIKDLVDSKIFKYTNTNDLMFYSDSILAYFAGKKISDIRNKEEGKSLIKHLIKNICFGINGEVLKFIIAFNNEAELLNMLLDESIAAFQDMEEFSFEKENLSYLGTSIPKLKLKLPTNQTKETESKRIEAQERKIVHKKVETINVFDYTDEDLNKFINRQIKLHKLSIFTSTLYSNFYHIIFAEDKDKYLKEIFSQPNKIAYFMLEPFGKDFNKSIETLHDEIFAGNENIKKENIVEVLVRVSEIIILNLYDSVARNCISDETISSLKKYACTDGSINYKIMLVMMLENMNSLEAFGKLAEELDDTCKNSYVSDMIRQIVRKHFIWNNVPMIGYGQHLSDKYFENEKKIKDKIRKRTYAKKR